MRLEARGDQAEASPRIDFLDGLRGLAALYVVLHHAALMVPPVGLSTGAAVARFLLRHGHYAVSLFVVLSGYCLMLRVLERGNGRLPGGTLAYFRRRGWRILPPYYAALGLCWVLIAAVPALGRPEQTPWDRALPAFGPGSIVAHLLLVHNLDGHAIFRIAPPFWSLATEWQAFLLFPALLAIRRRWGVIAAGATALILGEAVALLSLPLNHPALRVLCPWYLGLLTMGMAGALASRTSHPFRTSLAKLASRGKVLAVCVLTTGLSSWALRATTEAYVMISDLLLGAALTALVVRWSRLSARSDAHPDLPRHGVLRLLESRGLVAAGALSYSLYLTHYPILALANLTLRDCGWSPDARQAALILVISPFCILVADLFRRVFERAKSPASNTAPTAGDTPGDSRRVLGRRFPVIENFTASGLLQSDS